VGWHGVEAGQTRGTLKMAARGDDVQLAIGIVASLTPNTGNMHTCSRLQQVFVTAGHECTLIDCNDNELSQVSLIQRAGRR